MYPCSVFREVPAARRPRQLPQLLVVVRSAANNRTQLQFQSGEQQQPGPSILVTAAGHRRHRAGTESPRPGIVTPALPSLRHPHHGRGVGECLSTSPSLHHRRPPPSCAVNNHCNYTIGHTDHTLDLIQLQNWIICSLAK